MVGVLLLQLFTLWFSQLAEGKNGSSGVITYHNSKTITKPDFQLYHTSDRLFQTVRDLVKRNPDKLMIETSTLELNGYSGELHTVTVNFRSKGYFKKGQDKRIRALLDFGQHGREPITCEVALKFLETLVGEKNDSISPKQQMALNSLLPHMVIKIIPLENVNGYKKVEKGELCERKNGRGVDTNRNWSVDWGKKEKDYDPREEYPGTGPFSEPEAELLRRLASSFSPHVWINVHSGMEALFMPFDHVRKLPEDGSAEPMSKLLHNLNVMHFNRICVVGSGGTSVGYLAHGTATDWMFKELKVPLAFTFEIYGDLSAHENDCFRMFNPIESDVFEKVVSNWTSAFVTLITELPNTLEKVPFRTKPPFQWSLNFTEESSAMGRSRPRKFGKPWKSSPMEDIVLRVPMLISVVLTAGVILHIVRLNLRFRSRFESRKIYAE